MYDRTNDERLKILQERLAQIKEKRENPTSQRSQRREFTEVSTPKVEKSREKKDPNWGLEEKETKSLTSISETSVAVSAISWKPSQTREILISTKR